MGTVLLLALAAWGLARVFLGYPGTARPMRRLSRREVATVTAAAEATFPPGGAIEPSGSDADVAGYLDRMLDVSQPRIRLQIHLLLFLVEHATLFFPAPGWDGFRRYSSLSFDQRVAALDGWAESRIFVRRLVFTSLRALFTLAYFAHPPVLRQLRLAPYAIESPVCEADLLYPRIGALPETIAYTSDDLSKSDGVPIDLDGPLHPAYAERAR